MTTNHNPADRFIVYPERCDIAPGEEFQDLAGRTWVAITGSVGYKLFGIPMGMVTDPANPEPDNAITAVLKSKVQP